MTKSDDVAAVEERDRRLLARLEQHARNNPAGFRRRLVLLAVIGQATPVLLLVICAMGLVATVQLFDRIEYIVFGGVYLAGALVVASIIIVASMRVREAMPAGIEVRRERAPALFGVLDDLSRRLECPPPDHVLIDSRLGASTDLPRPRRLLARRTRILLLGYPLLCALTVEQAVACLAFAMAQLAGRRAALRRWSYRVDQTWSKLVRAGPSSAEGPGWDAMSPIRWFIRLFRAHQYVYAHQCEREGDQTSVEIAGAAATVDMLLAVALRWRVYEHSLMPAILSRVREESTPPLYPMSGVARAAGNALPVEEVEQALAKELSEPTPLWDQHVPLRERIALIRGVPPDAVEASAAGLANGPAVSAAEHFLGPWAMEVDRLLDEWFMAGPGAEWRARNAGYRRARERLMELDARAKEAPLAGPEASERAQIIATVYDSDKVVGPLMEHVAAHPDDACGRFYLGCALLDAGQDEGFEHLDVAMRLAPEYTEQVCQSGHRRALERGNTDFARRYQEAAQLRSEEDALAFSERHTLSPRDDWRPHNLPQEQVDAIIGGLASERRVRIGYLVRKQTRLMPDKQFHVLGVVVGPSLGLERRGSGTLEWRLNRAACMPVESTVVVLRGDDARLRRPLSQVPGAEIYRRR